MRIFFGRGSYTIKRINPKDLGLEGTENDTSEIQLRQKYAHLYFIPIFPLGQVWVVKRDGKLYDIHEKLNAILHYKHPKKFPHIGSFALPIILLLGFFIITIVDSIRQHQYKTREQEELVIKRNLLNKQINNLNAKEQYFVFGEYENSIYKVLKIDKDNVLLGKTNSSNDNESYYSLPDPVRYFAKYKLNNSQDSVWVSKSDLKKSVKASEDFKPANISNLEKNKTFELDKIVTINDAYFKEETDPETNTVFYKEYKNFGLDAILDSIIPEHKGEVWKLSKQKIIKFGEKFAVKTESENKANLYYHTITNNKSHSVKVDRNSIDNFYDK